MRAPTHTRSGTRIIQSRQDRQQLGGELWWERTPDEPPGATTSKSPASGIAGGGCVPSAGDLPQNVMRPAEAVVAFCRTTNTEQWAWRTTLSETLPMKNRSTPWRPCEPMTMQSHGISAA